MELCQLPVESYSQISVLAITELPVPSLPAAAARSRSRVPQARALRPGAPQASARDWRCRNFFSAASTSALGFSLSLRATASARPHLSEVEALAR